MGKIGKKAEGKKVTGPKPERVNIDMDWEDAMKRALKKKRPKDGWPKPDKDKDSDQEEG